MTLTVAIVGRADLPPDRRIGGMQGVNDAVLRAAAAAGVPTVRNPTPARVRDLASGGSVLVFTQKDVRLTPDYRAWAEDCLAAGATVVEKNVFAQPSRYRPMHPRYVHALMSMDGAHRFAWRSAAAGLPAPSRFALLPNPLLLDPVAPRTPRDPSRVRLLRVGRPDPVKWSTWEQELAVAMAMARPAVRVELLLVGVPDSCRLPAAALPANLDIVRRPVVDPATLAGHFAEADAYVLSSRIGETYGNTLAEAQVAGCYVVAGLDPVWDCAPLEFLAEDTCWTGAPARALRQAGSILDAIVAAPARVPEADAVASVAAYLGMLVALADDSGPLRLPTRSEALAYLRSVGRRLDGVRGELRAPAIEAVRALKNRVAGGAA